MNIEKLTDKLTELHVMALYDFMCPLDYSIAQTANEINNRKRYAFDRYYNDVIFHQRIGLIVAREIDIIAKCEN